MANLLRFGVAQALRTHLVHHKRLQPLQTTGMNFKISSRFINTSSKPPQASHSETPATCPDVTTEDKPRTWVSWGFHEDNEFLDRVTAHWTFFMTISVILCGCSFIMAYMPDPKLREWAQREAYLQLRYKEDHGLPPIDRNYIDPSKIILPEDDEIGPDEILI